MSRDNREHHFQRVVHVVMATLKKDAKASLNDLCRACVDADVQCSKPLVARARKVVVGIVKQRDQLEKRVGPDGQMEYHVSLPRTKLPELAGPPDVSEAERTAKAQRDAEREAEASRRRQEREIQWAKERDEERKAFEATHNAVVEAMREVAMRTEPEVSISEPVSGPVPAQPDSPALEPSSGRTRSAADRALRRQYLNALLDADPGAEPIVLMGKLKERFGVGLDGDYVYETCRVARELAGLPQIPYIHNPSRAEHERPGLPVFGAPTVVVTEKPVEEEWTTPEEDLQWLAQQARDVMRAHNLSELALVADENEAEWTSTTKPKRASGKMRF